MIRLVGELASHVGNVRDVNQDRGLVKENLFAVADGMGGHRGGEVAAALTISTLENSADQLAPGDLVEMAKSANELVYERSEEDDLLGMGTTLVAIGLYNSEVVEVINIGDSRCYWLRDGYLAQVTRDHSFVEDLLEHKEISAQEAFNHPKRNIITRALGIAPEVEVDSFTLNVRVNDRFMMCSDGLTDEVTEEEIVEILTSNSDSKEAAQKLVDRALLNGGKDNVTTVIVDVLEDSLADPSGMSTETVEEGAIEKSESSKVVEDALESEVEEVTSERKVIMADRAGLAEVAKQPKIRILIGLCLLGAMALSYLSLRSYSESNWFLKEDSSGFVAVYQGRPGGFLWFEPVKKSVTNVTVGSLQPASLVQLGEADSFDSAESARFYVDNLETIVIQSAKEQDESSVSSIVSLES